MIFEKLELVNFKSHVNSTIEFNHGITLIIGENGAGKSSIFEAITFALFSESLVNNIDLVRTNKGISDKIKMEVKLTFAANSNHYRVERTVTKKNDKQTAAARLFQIVDGRDELITEGVTRVNNEIQIILSMNSKTFLNAIHIRQGEISSLIDDTPAERKKLIGQLLRLDDLEKAHKEMHNVTDIFVREKEKIEVRIQDENELKGALEENTGFKNDALAQNAAFAKELEVLNKDSEVKTGQKEKLDSQKQNLEHLKVRHDNDIKFHERLKKTNADLTAKLEEIAKNEEEMNVLRPSVEKLQSFNDFKNTLISFNTLKKDETSKSEVLDKINRYRQIIETRKESYERYVELDSELQKLNLLKTQLESEIRAADDLAKNKEKSVSQLEKYNMLYKKALGECEVTLSPYGITEIQDESLEDIAKTVENVISDIKTKTGEIDTQINECNSRIGSLQQEIISSKKPLLEVRKVENKCPTCQSDISPDQKNRLINTYEVIISDDTKEINRIREMIDDLNGQKASNDEELRVLDRLKSQISKNLMIPGEIEKLTSDIEELTVKINELSQKNDQLTEAISDIGAKTEEMKLHEAGYKEYVDANTLLSNQDDEQTVKSQLSKITDNLKVIESRLSDLQGADETLSVDMKMEDLDHKIRDLGEKNNRYNNLEGTVKDKADYEERLKVNLSEIENKQKEIEETEKIIDSCSYDSEVHANLTNEVSEIAVKISELTKNVAVNEARIQSFDEKIAEITAKIEQNRIYKAQYDAVSEYLDILYDFKELYGKNGIQRDLRAQSKPLIQKYTREFFEKFNFNYSDLKLSDEYDITIYGPDGEVKLNMVSGGEKIAIALSLRLGITQVMSKGNIETILLDEPTIHLDSFRRQELINVLRSMSVIPQMIIVTHDEELETAADSLIKVIKEDGISKVSDD